jgi:prepilin-type N-terminal cleavage/methylation domain-containing protein
MMKSTKQPLKKQGGFSLVELLVAVGIFSAVMLLVVSSFLYLNSARKIASDKQSILNELRFAIDLIGKEITSGSAFPSNCENGCDSIVFATKIRPDVPLRRVEYSLDTATGIIMRGEQKTFGICSILGGPWGPGLAPECFQPLTSAQAKVELFKFFVNNKETGLQPIVNVVMEGNIKEEKFQVASTHSPRFLQDPGASPPSDNERPTIRITDPTPEDTTCDPGPPWPTDEPNVVLKGTADDNVGVVEVNWRKVYPGNDFGLATLSAPPPQVSVSWFTPSLPLSRFDTNRFEVEAKDVGGNKSFPDDICINTTAPPPDPAIDLIDSFCTIAGDPYIYFEWSPVDELAGAHFHIERCFGVCTPATPVPEDTCLDPDYPCTWNNSFSDFEVAADDTYSYRLRAHDHNDGTFHPYSNVVTKTARNDCVASPPGGDFTLSANPRVISVGRCNDPTVRRTSSESRITVNATPNFNADVVLSASGGPPGTDPNFLPNTLTSSQYTSGSFFSVSIPDNTTLGIYTLIVTGTGGGNSDSINVYLDVKECGYGEL